MRNIFKNYTQKIDFIDKILENDYIPNKKELKRLYILGKEKDAGIRLDVTEALGIRYTPQNEKYLLNMTYDKDNLVRVGAVEALSVGRKKETLSRLKNLFTDNNYMIRGYAVNSYFNVWVNRYGYNVENMRKYRKKIHKYKKLEKNKWVQASYEKADYIAGNQEGLNNIIHKIRSYTGDDYHVFSALVNSAKAIRNIWNAAEINKELKSVLNIIPRCYLVDDIKEFINSTEYPRVLILDNSNTGLSQLLEFLGNYLYYYNLFYSAGIQPGKKINSDLIELIQNSYSVNIERYQYPKRMNNIWNKQFIVPIGVEIGDELFPFQKVIHIFEHMGEECLSIEKGKEMLNKIISEICRECSTEGIQFDSQSIFIPASNEKEPDLLD